MFAPCCLLRGTRPSASASPSRTAGRVERAGSRSRHLRMVRRVARPGGRDTPFAGSFSGCMMFNTAFAIVLAMAAGVSVVVQQALNANLRTALGSAAWSGFLSYLIGLICMIALAIAVRD